MLYGEVIAICSEIHTKHINTLCWQNVEFVIVKPDGKDSNQWVLEDTTFAVQCGLSTDGAVWLHYWLARSHARTGPVHGLGVSESHPSV